MGAEVFHALAAVLKKHEHSTNVGDEGGFAPNLKNNEEPIEVILEAVCEAGYRPGDDVSIALDPASSEFYEDGKYVFARRRRAPAQRRADGRVLRRPDRALSDRVDRGRARGRRLGGMEDSDAAMLGAKMQLVGDDIFVTNPKLLTRGIKEDVGNSILIKVNQIGTLSETLEDDRDGAGGGL